MKRLTILVLLVYSLIGLNHLVEAQFLWGEAGIPVRTGLYLNWNGNSQTNLADETYVLWDDSRGDFSCVYAQKFSAEGVPLWQEGGINIGGAYIGPSTMPVMDLSVDGGFIAVWGQNSLTGFEIKAQRVDGDGNLLWGANGAPVLSTMDWIMAVQAVQDGANGVLVVWNLYDSWLGSCNIYVQRIDSSGNIAQGWDPNGVLVASHQQSETIEFIEFAICRDNEFGVIITWNDLSGNCDIHVQRVSADGELLWGVNGVPICVQPGTQDQPRIAADNAGGAFIAWTDNRTLNCTNIYIQRVNSAGNPLWTLNGIPLNLNFEIPQFNPSLIADDAGNAFVAWVSGNYTIDFTIYCQKVDDNGNSQWITPGVNIFGPADYLYDYKLASDDAGGLFLTWSNTTPAGEYGIYAQYVNTDGRIVWQTNGIIVGEAGSGGGFPVVQSLSDNDAIFSWFSWIGEQNAIYLQKVNPQGNLQFPGNGVSAIAGLAGDADDIKLQYLPPDRTIAVYTDTRILYYGKLFYQLFDMEGDPQVAENGLEISNMVYDQEDAKIAATSDGSAIVAWEEEIDLDTHRIYTQKIDSAGNILWGASGIEISNQLTVVHHIQFYPYVCSDDNGGAFIGFHSYDGLSATVQDIYVQLVTADGRQPWSPATIGLTFDNHPKHLRGIVSDGEGGAIAAWDWSINTNYSSYDIYTARILADGQVVWNQAICDLPHSNQSDTYIIPSRDGGAVIAWRDYRNGYYRSIFAQKVDNDGNFLWAENGVSVIDLEGNSVEHVMLVEDDEGYTYYIWEDSRGAGYRSIYCQRLSPQGQQMFDEEGICVCDETDFVDEMDLIPDGEGGIIVVWDDDRYGYNCPEVFITHLDSTGALAAPIWIEDGNPVGAGLGNRYHSAVTTDGEGGVILGWTGITPVLPSTSYVWSNWDLYIQRMNENIVSVSGNDFQDILSTFHLSQNYPNPFNAETVISFVLPTSGKVSIKVYNLLGEEIVTVMEDYLPAGEREVKFNGEGLTSGIYFYQLKTEGQFSTKKFVLMK